MWFREIFLVVMFEQKHERRSGEQGSKSVLGTYVVHFHPTPDFWT